MPRLCLVLTGIVIPSLLLIFTPARCNDTISPSVIGIRSHLAFVLIHSKSVRSIRNSYPVGFGIDLKKRYTSKRARQACNCYPMIGFSLTYWDFNNPQILGHGLSALFFVEPFFGFKRKVNLSLRAGFGLSYLSNPYDEIENPNNLSYSTHLGFPLLLSLNLNYQLNPKINLNIGANYNHISNGGVKFPNKGINYPSVDIGIDYYIKPATFTDFGRLDWKKDTVRRRRHDVSVLLSLTSIEPNIEARYAVYGGSYNFSYRIARISALNAGCEWVADKSLQKQISRDSLDVDYKRGSLLLGHEFLLGRFVFSQQIGIYLYDQIKRNGLIYQRYGLIFLINRRFHLGFNLKTHGHIADFMDFRIGISF